MSENDEFAAMSDPEFLAERKRGVTLSVPAGAWKRFTSGLK
jgi:hypothetical protein